MIFEYTSIFCPTAIIRLDSPSRKASISKRFVGFAGYVVKRLLRTVLSMSKNQLHAAKSAKKLSMRIRVDPSRLGPLTVQEALLNLTTVISSALVEDYAREVLRRPGC